MALSAGTRSSRDLAIVSRSAASSARAASAAARLDAAAAAASSFLGFLSRPRADGDEVCAPSQMTRVPPLRPLVSGVDAGSFFTILGVDADPDERDADLDADPDQRDAIRRGIHELPWRRYREGTCGSGIPKTG
jgi:hypothetical protein